MSDKRISLVKSYQLYNLNFSSDHPPFRFHQSLRVGLHGKTIKFGTSLEPEIRFSLLQGKFSRVLLSINGKIYLLLRPSLHLLPNHFSGCRQFLIGLTTTSTYCLLLRVLVPLYNSSLSFCTDLGLPSFFCFSVTSGLVSL